MDEREAGKRAFKEGAKLTENPHYSSKAKAGDLQGL